jgi:hypothetical protein
MHTRIRRVIGALCLAGTLTAGSLVNVAVAANPAGWGASATPTPPMVTNGQPAGFVVHFQNDGPSNISQLFLVATTPVGATFVTAYVIGASRTGGYTGGTCNAGGPLLCNVGPVNDGQGFNIQVVYTTPASGSSMPVSFEFNTTGVPGGKNNSHGDSLVAPTSVALNSSTRDFFGFFAVDPNGVASDDQTLTNKNKQSTKAFGPNIGGIQLTVGEAPLGTFVCPSDPLRTRPCFSQWSTLNVDGGTSFPDGFKVQIGFSHFELPNGIDASNIKFIHVKDGANPGTEVIKNQCSSSSPAPSELPCYLAVDSGMDVIATLFLTENGRINGW